MNTTAADTAPHSEVTVQRPLTLSTTLATLVRREFWEHPGLWRAPAIVAGLLAISTVFSMTVSIDDRRMTHMGGPDRIMVLNASQDLWVSLIYLVAAVVVTFYVLDTLYTERKDRSILFWKSLPVSDGLTVLSKFLVAVIVVPLGVFVLAIASHMVAFAIWKMRVAAGGMPDMVAWDAMAWLRGETVILLCLILSSLWYAPVVAAGLLVSAWVRRNPVLWATLPLLFLPIFEYVFFRTSYLWRFISYRSGGIWNVLTTRDGHTVMSESMHMLSDFNWAAAFTSLDLWLGVAATAALLYATVRTRRYRDDTAS
jgi:ABC-2 type transport system permease protein